jgi:hypothetical protein
MRDKLKQDIIIYKTGQKKPISPFILTTLVPFVAQVFIYAIRNRPSRISSFQA